MSQAEMGTNPVENNNNKINDTVSMCKQHEESVFHLVCSYPVLAPTLYLSTRHNQVARIIYQEILHNDQLIYKPPPITKQDSLEIWWDIPINTTRRLPHANKCCAVSL